MILAKFLREAWCLDPFRVSFSEWGAPMPFNWMYPTTAQWFKTKTLSIHEICSFRKQYYSGRFDVVPNLLGPEKQV